MHSNNLCVSLHHRNKRLEIMDCIIVLQLNKEGIGLYRRSSPKNYEIFKLSQKKMGYLGVWRPKAPVSLNELRRMQVERLPKHRGTIVDRLRSYGLKRLSHLPLEYYGEYKDFLLTLAP